LQQTIQNVETARVVEITTQLVDVDKELIAAREGAALATRRAEAARLLIGERGHKPLGEAGQPYLERAFVPQFYIRRETDGKMQQLDASGDLLLEPLDLLIVEAVNGALD